MALFTEGSTRGYSSDYRDRMDGRGNPTDWRNPSEPANPQNSKAAVPGTPAQTPPAATPSAHEGEIRSSMDVIARYQSSARQYITPAATQTVAANTAATQATPAANSEKSYGYDQLQLKGFTPSETGEKS